MNHHNHHMNHTVSDANISAPVMNHSAHNHHDHSSTSHMHSMSFHFGSDETVLFSFWVVTSSIGIVTTCALTVFMCFIMESIRWFRGIRPPYNVDLHTEQSSVANLKFAPRITTAMCMDAILHAIQLTLSYVLMLLFMTFNVWICTATVLGEVFARLIFAVLSGEKQVMKGNRTDVGCCT
uniref:Copper transport protein n=1 Tax=Elaeophora elaphi TaxID=1147741 RepID=A0A0R3RTY0_9BILA